MTAAAVGRTEAEGRQSRGPRKTHREHEIYLPQLGKPAICACGCVAAGCVTNAAVMQQGANADQQLACKCIDDEDIIYQCIGILKPKVLVYFITVYNI